MICVWRERSEKMINQQHFFCLIFTSLTSLLRRVILLAFSITGLRQMASLIIAQLSLTFTFSLTDVLTYRIPFLLDQSCTSRSFTRTSMSFLFPTSRYTAQGHLALAISYHFDVAFKKVQGLVRSKTSITPWHPLKQVETTERYFSWPAVSQMNNLTAWPSILTSLILKSMMVTPDRAYCRNYPQMQRQKRVVLPTYGSPIMIILQWGSFPEEKQRYSII